MVRKARIAQGHWAHVSLRERLKITRRLRHRIADHARELAECIGSPHRDLAVSLAAEVMPLADACRFLERQSQRILCTQRWTGWTRPLWLLSTHLTIRREPFGVVLIIGPGNYPLLLPGIQTLQALVAGNAVLVKPAPGGAQPMLRLREWLIDAGLNSSLLTILDTDTTSVDHAINAGVDKVVLTGSADTGQTVMRRLAPSLIPSTMELSGCDAVFVCDDADLDLTARCLVFGMTLNDGQTCISPRRVFVPVFLKGELERRLRALTRDLPFIPIRPATAIALSDLLHDANQNGARILAGELDQPASRIKPLILTDANPNMALLQEDVFAPITSLVGVVDVEQALAWNALCPYALAATIFGRRNAQQLAEQIHAGVVVINDMIVPHADPRLPFAPRGRSGFGVTRGAEGLLDMTRPKAISQRTGRFRPHLEPHRPDDARLFCDYLQAAHGRSLSRRISAIGKLARILLQRVHSQGGSS